jgi:hypothetical protein
MGSPGSPIEKFWDRKPSKNLLTSGAGFSPRRSGYLGKIAWSSAVLFPTLKVIRSHVFTGVVKAEA